MCCMKPLFLDRAYIGFYNVARRQYLYDRYEQDKKAVEDKYRINMDDFIVVIPLACSCHKKPVVENRESEKIEESPSQRYLNVHGLYTWICARRREEAELRKFYDKEVKKCLFYAPSAIRHPLH
jgi:hypothetical protein